MSTQIATVVKTEQAQAVADVFNTSGTTLSIYTGSQPADADSSATGTLLATLNLPNPCFSAASSGAISKTGTWSGTASASGTAGWFRIENGSYRIDGTIGTSGQDMNLSSTSIISGGTVTINTASFTVV